MGLALLSVLSCPCWAVWRPRALGWARTEMLPCCWGSERPPLAWHPGYCRQAALSHGQAPLGGDLPLASWVSEVSLQLIPPGFSNLQSSGCLSWGPRSARVGLEPLWFLLPLGYWKDSYLTPESRV